MLIQISRKANLCQLHPRLHFLILKYKYPVVNFKPKAAPETKIKSQKATLIYCRFLAF